jgi:hypothetical protein
MDLLEVVTLQVAVVVASLALVLLVLIHKVVTVVLDI